MAAQKRRRRSSAPPMSNQKRRDAVIISGGAENIGHAVYAETDERLAYGRDIVREILRDGCVRGSFTSE